MRLIKAAEVWHLYHSKNNNNFSVHYIELFNYTVGWSFCMSRKCLTQYFCMQVKRMYLPGCIPIRSPIIFLVPAFIERFTMIALIRTVNLGENTPSTTVSHLTLNMGYKQTPNRLSNKVEIVCFLKQHIYVKTPLVALSIKAWHKKTCIH